MEATTALFKAISDENVDAMKKADWQAMLGPGDRDAACDSAGPFDHCVPLLHELIHHAASFSKNVVIETLVRGGEEVIRPSPQPSPRWRMEREF